MQPTAIYGGIRVQTAPAIDPGFAVSVWKDRSRTRHLAALRRKTPVSPLHL